MSYFLYNNAAGPRTTLELSGDEAGHILKSRRMKKGETFELQDNRSKRYRVEIIDITKNSLKCFVLEELAVPQEPDLSVSLFLSTVNEKALDFVLQKTTELGVKNITLFNSQNTAYKLSVEQFKKKSERWQKILWEAAKQSGRAVVPELNFFSDLNRIILELKKAEKIFLCDAEGKQKKNLGIPNQTYKSCAIIVGPEGGFTTEEIKKIKSLKNTETIKLSNFTLRAETTAITGLSVLLNC